MYDYLIVGSGLFGATFANYAKSKGKKCLIIEKRSHSGGNVYCESIEGINVHKYGPHIFHTNNKKIWDWINKYCEMENYIFSPVAKFNKQIFSLPFNLWTFFQLWGITDENLIKQKIKKQSLKINKPSNLEEQAISIVGSDIYEKLIKGYTKKQWGKDPKLLPTFIIKRLPVRFTFNNNYFNDQYQGIPKNGYTEIFEKLLNGIDIELNTDFFSNKSEFLAKYDLIVYTGPIDKFFDYKFGKLEYRSLKWKNEELSINNFQGNSVVNYTSEDIPYTRIIEHKHFNKKNISNFTIISKEFPQNYTGENEPYYPVNDLRNDKIYLKYKELSLKNKKVIFGGRLAKYKYYDMHQVIASALKDSKNIIEKLKSKSN